MTVKVLQNPYIPTEWMSLEDYHGLNIEFMPPRYRRSGWYYSREHDLSWIEVQLKGVWLAYTLKDLEESFKYDLKLLNHRPLLPKEVAAFQTVRRMLPTKVLDLLHLDRCWKDIREVGRNSRKSTLKYLRMIND